MNIDLSRCLKELGWLRDELRQYPDGSLERYKGALISEALQHLERAALPDEQMVQVHSEDFPFMPQALTEGWVERRKGFYQLRTETLNCFIQGGPRKGWRWDAQIPPEIGDRKWITRSGFEKRLEDAQRAAEYAFAPDEIGTMRQRF